MSSPSLTGGIPNPPPPVDPHLWGQFWRLYVAYAAADADVPFMEWLWMHGVRDPYRVRAFCTLYHWIEGSRAF